jgi:hypothetical protein
MTLSGFTAIALLLAAFPPTATSDARRRTTILPPEVLPECPFQ